MPADAVPASSSARTASVSSALRSELAPTGRLRAGMNLSNALFTQKDAATGALRGVSVDLMTELASRLGVPLELVVYPTPGEVADDAAADKWDVAILAIEQARAEKIAFSPPITAIEATYIVHDDSPLHDAAKGDAAGVRIAAPEKAGYELFLARTLQHATLLRAKNFAGSLELFRSRQADALAGLKPTLLETLPQLAGCRLLDGTFMTVNHGLGIPRGRAAGANFVAAFVDELVASGFIARAIERNGVQGLAAVRRG